MSSSYYVHWCETIPITLYQKPIDITSVIFFIIYFEGFIVQLTYTNWRIFLFSRIDISLCYINCWPSKYRHEITYLSSIVSISLSRSWPTKMKANEINLSFSDSREEEAFILSYTWTKAGMDQFFSYARRYQKIQKLFAWYDILKFWLKECVCHFDWKMKNSLILLNEWHIKISMFLISRWTYIRLTL